MNDVMPGSDGLRILGDFWKKSSELRSKAGRGELIFESRRGQSIGVYEMRRAWWGQMEQSA